MGLKPDHWICKMAHEHRMIEPFEDKQVREGVISYGVSSYGYDVRVADEFKIFTNVFSATVDPKNFDTKSMVDFIGDVCVVPPNSFALARTVEYFRIPRKVLTICLGKSTYARCGIIVNVTPFEPCFADDTEILTRHGWRLVRDVQVSDQVLGMGKDGIAEWQPVENKQEYFYEGNLIHFGGKSVDLFVTPEHKLLVRKRIMERKNTKGRYPDWFTMPAGELRGKYNYEMMRSVHWMGKDVGDQVAFGEKHYPTDAFLEFLGLYIGDGSSYINKGGYLIKIAAFKKREVKVTTDVLGRLGVRYNRTDTGFQFFSKELYQVVNPLGHAHEKYIPDWVKELPPAQLERLLFGLMNSDGNNETETYTTTSNRLADDVQEVMFKAGYTAIVRCAKPEAHRNYKGHVIKSNHPVYKVRLGRSHLTPKIHPRIEKEIPYEGMVYDVTVPGHLIFVRRNGKPVWSGNCWEGFVTLEISNTTPLPAKIYANEGLAQVLFFEADEECETSYADKKGKYQKQQSIVLPKL
jgi:deoxycytidine triphosphate deaminase